MSAINPDDPTIISPLNTPGVGPSTVAPLTEDFTIQDTSSVSAPAVTFQLAAAANNPILNPTSLSIIEFAKLIGSKLLDLKNTQNDNQLADDLSLRSMHINAFLSADALTEIFNKATRLATDQKQAIDDLNDAKQNLNQVLANYNQQIQEDQNQTDIMNQAIQDYNNGVIDEATFNGIANNYNNYVSSRAATLGPLLDQVNAAITAYNDAVTQYNSAIADINATRVQFGLAALPFQPSRDPIGGMPYQGPPPTPGQVPFLPNRVQNGVTLTPPAETQAELVDLLFTPAYEGAVPPAAAFADILQLIKQFRDFIKFFLTGKIITEPDTYIEKLPAVFFSQSAGGADSISGVAMGSYVIGLDNRALERIFSNSIYEAATREEDQSLPPQLVDQIKFYGLKLLALTGLTAGSTALGLLADKLPFINVEGSPRAVALGLAFANQISRHISEGQTKEAVDRFIKQNLPGLTDAEAAKLSDTLTAQLNLSLLQFSTTQVAQSLGFSTLTTGVTANVQGLPTQDAILQAGGPLSFRDALENPVSSAYLKNTLAEQIVADVKLSRDVANQIANDSINSAIAKQSLSEDQFKADLQNELAARGIANPGPLAESAGNYVNAEAGSQNLLDVAVNPILLTNTGLLASLNGAGINAAVSAQIVNSILDNILSSQRELRDRIAEELKVQGIQEREALVQATKAVIHNQTVQTETISKDRLAADLTNRAIEALSSEVGFATGQKLANQLVLTLLSSPTSVLNQISDQVRALKAAHGESINTALAENFRDFMNTNYEVFSFAEKIRDPGEKYISLWSGLIYGKNDKDQKSVDILI